MGWDRLGQRWWCVGGGGIVMVLGMSGGVMGGFPWCGEALITSTISVHPLNYFVFPMFACSSSHRP